jgi:hypothetical protein
MTDHIYEVLARVIYVPTKDTIQILLAPGQGMADGGIPTNIPLKLVPFELRTPNTRLQVSIVNDEITSVRIDDTIRTESRSAPKARARARWLRRWLALQASIRGLFKST